MQSTLRYSRLKDARLNKLEMAVSYLHMPPTCREGYEQPDTIPIPHEMRFLEATSSGFGDANLYDFYRIREIYSDVEDRIEGVE